MKRRGRGEATTYEGEDADKRREEEKEREREKGALQQTGAARVSLERERKRGGGEDPQVLAYIKPGQKRWTQIWGCGDFHDAIYHKGKFYAVDMKSHVISLDVSESNTQVNKL